MRLACVDIPAFPMQLMLRDNPTWRDEACVIIKDDRPMADILWANAASRRLGIQPGMRFAEAQALTHTLHVSVDAPHRMAILNDELWQILLKFTPNVEPAADCYGLFWLDPNGLTHVFNTLENWITHVHDALAQHGFVNTVVVGFNRYYVYALARSRRRSVVIEDAAQERILAHAVLLNQLAISSALLGALTPLGVRTLGEFLQLPLEDLRQRMGHEAERIYRLANETVWAPLRPQRPVEPFRVTLQIEPAEADHGRIMFFIKRLLPRLLEPLKQKLCALVGLQVCFELDHHEPFSFQLEPAAPTLDEAVLLELLRLRLVSHPAPAAVQTIMLTAAALPLPPSQIALLQQRPKRDLLAASGALAKLRAALGNDAVTRAQLRASHLPETSFVWQPIVETTLPQCEAAEQLPPLMRRIFTPQRLPPRPRHEPETWLGAQGTVTRMVGPFRVSTGWWSASRERDYYYVATQHNDILWTFYDRVLRRWFLHGIVD